MRIDFPKRVDAFPVNIDLDTRNTAQQTNECTIVDLMYAVRELQKYVLELAGIASPVTTETTATAVSVDLSSVNTQIAALSAQIAALPAYLSGIGAPSAGLGKNGDTYWDTVGLYEWRKVGGSWRQQQ